MGNNNTVKFSIRKEFRDEKYCEILRDRFFKKYLDDDEKLPYVRHGEVMGTELIQYHNSEFLCACKELNLEWVQKIYNSDEFGLEYNFDNKHDWPEQRDYVVQVGPMETVQDPKNPKKMIEVMVGATKYKKGPKKGEVIVAVDKTAELNRIGIDHYKLKETPLTAALSKSHWEEYEHPLEAAQYRKSILEFLKDEGADLNNIPLNREGEPPNMTLLDRVIYSVQSFKREYPSTPKKQKEKWEKLKKGRGLPININFEILNQTSVNQEIINAKTTLLKRQIFNKMDNDELEQYKNRARTLVEFIRRLGGTFNTVGEKERDSAFRKELENYYHDRYDLWGNQIYKVVDEGVDSWNGKHKQYIVPVWDLVSDYYLKGLFKISPLVVACEKGNLEDVKILRTDENVNEMGWIQGVEGEPMKFTLKRRVEARWKGKNSKWYPGQIDSRNETKRTYTITFDDKDVLEIPEYDIRSCMSPLEIAAIKGHVTIVEYLLKNGAKRDSLPRWIEPMVSVNSVKAFQPRLKF